MYTQYLEAAYTGADAGSDGTITGADIMAGLHINISADPYPDSFTITGPNAVAIFTNDAPKTDLSGLRIAKNGYKAIYFAWNFQLHGHDRRGEGRRAGQGHELAGAERDLDPGRSRPAARSRSRRSRPSP